MKAYQFILLNVLFIGTTTFLTAQTSSPKLIVGVVVDQMRYDYLNRYKNDYGEGGFKKLLKDGFSADNLHYHYKPTYTGPGHASIFTGAPPAKHGIVGNNWFSRKEQKVVYCAEALNKEGVYWFSPERMKGRTLSDEIKLFYGKESKSYGVSLKDRGAILPAGHLANGAFWFDSNSGKWLSSSYYKESNPTWLVAFNERDFIDEYLSEAWNLSLEEEDYSESNADKNNNENELYKGSGVEFPYNLLEAYRQEGWGILKTIPQGNSMTTDLAIEIIKANELGKDDVLDFISISYSATDYVGHRFGVGALEVHDTYVKLDRDLKKLIDFLESNLGKENFILFLTSDHGAGEVRNHLAEMGAPHGKIETNKIGEELDSILDARFGPMQWISSFTNLNVYFSAKAKESKILDFTEVLSFAKKWLSEQEGVQEVWEPHSGKNNFVYSDIIENGFNAKESGDLILLEEASWTNYSDKGSTHGSPYQYDTHVPFLMYGYGVKIGATSKAYNIANIIPTISKIVGVPRPNLSELDLIEESIK